MTILWRTLSGESATPAVVDAAEELGEGAMLVAAGPDWVRDPSGRTCRVFLYARTHVACRKCGGGAGEGAQVIYAVASHDGLLWSVRHHEPCGYVWARLTVEGFGEAFTASYRAAVEYEKENGYGP